MSINGINGTSGAARVAAPTADAAATTASSRAATTPPAPAEVTQKEADDRRPSVHFPWLSRLSAELEAASNKRARFPTQIMGDHLDKKA